MISNSSTSQHITIAIATMKQDMDKSEQSSGTKAPFVWHMLYTAKRKSLAGVVLNMHIFLCKHALASVLCIEMGSSRRCQDVSEPLNVSGPRLGTSNN